MAISCTTRKVLNQIWAVMDIINGGNEYPPPAFEPTTAALCQIAALSPLVAVVAWQVQ